MKEIIKEQVFTEAESAGISQGEYNRIKSEVHSTWKNDLMDNNLNDIFNSASQEECDILFRFLSGNLGVNPLAYVNTIKPGLLANVEGEVTLPKNVVKLEVGSFDGSKVSKINIQGPISYLPERCFANCPNLKEVVFPKSCSEVNVDKDALKNSPDVLVYVPTEALAKANFYFSEGSSDEEFEEERNFYAKHFKRLK